MIAIKMDMPKSCDKCKFCIDNGYLTSQCRFNFETVEDLRLNKVDKNCPLIDLPEENKDMSWEELVEKTDRFISRIADDSKWFTIKNLSLTFYENGDITDFSDDSINNADNNSPYQMWVIIKALIGDER